MNRSRILLYGIVCVAGLVLAAGGGQAATEEELKQAYQNAIRDAEVVEPAEVYNQLKPIRENDGTELWKDASDGKVVRVVTYTNWSGYDSLVGKKIRMQEFLPEQFPGGRGMSPMGYYTATRDLWVTLVPDVQQYLKGTALSGADLELRCKQLLGLPPYKVYNRFVEFWVKPGDLFRPSPDPETSDAVCDIEFPAGVSDAHKTWFTDLLGVQYNLDTGFPWTRLGYTYDWGNPRSEIGLSEYVVRTGATVEVHSVTFTEEYIHTVSEAGQWSLYN